MGIAKLSETVSKINIDYTTTTNENNITNKELQTQQKKILSTPSFEIYYGVAGLLAVFLYRRK
ncbi:PGF-CTERM sorting domain-containing protein [Methanosarcina sp. Z-7115]|uniref:PGF-CTERM sorting domain-containing protein n=1 Tax=Methanosarcina baikalica TaxID=3073890 RepID=A0ABU2D1Y7_9EURY|nr:PGF-CTERM sorting domain-containing protein [Methanosarcina sp. Z-7115]MDR7665847.1 PGF-CTERM sorting domain-containing protein [Methanosarcina sp. Z-7115]